MVSFISAHNQIYNLYFNKQMKIRHLFYFFRFAF